LGQWRRVGDWVWLLGILGSRWLSTFDRRPSGGRTSRNEFGFIVDPESRRGDYGKGGNQDVRLAVPDPPANTKTGPHPIFTQQSIHSNVSFQLTCFFYFRTGV
jgi:hypothetical protein